MDFLIEVAITSLSIIGIYGTTDYELDRDGNPTEKNVFWFVRYYAIQALGETWSKPVISCPRCMGSLWGVIFHSFVFCHSYCGVYDFISIAVFILCVSTLNRIIFKAVEQ